MSLAPIVVEPPVKPRLRGVSHQIASVVALVAGALLFHRTRGDWPRMAVAIYTASLVTLFTVSALYHRVHWQPGPRQWMRRLDHGAIFVFIAGSYTPLSLGLSPSQGSLLRTIAWCGAAAGVAQSVLWVRAPKPLIAVLYLVLGWSIVPFVRDVWRSFGTAPLALVFIGGVIYSLGALVYAKKRPDPVPAVFGYHEVFHGLVVLAAVLHFVAVALIVGRD
jgi:hemolysin III